MFEVATTLLSNFIDMLPYLIAFYLIFDFLGSLLFGRR